MTQLAELTVTQAEVPIVRVAGEIDLSNVDELKQAIEAAALDKAHGLIADLGRVTYLDTASLALLDEVCRCLARKNIELHLVLPADRHIRRSLRLVELPDTLPVHDNLEDARQAALSHTVAATAAVVEQLRAALTTRDIIGMAKGILIATRGWCTPDEAFEVLRQASQDRNMKLRDLAQELVDLATTFAGQGLNGGNDRRGWNAAPDGDAK